MKFIEHRIADKRVHRFVKKWLKAGVLEQGELNTPDEGVPQGGSISPLLANIYLHYVLDLWVDSWRENHARGEVYIIRYADDFVVGFQYESDAKKFREELGERLAAFNLELNDEKTRLIKFGRFADKRDKPGGGKPATFTFLGFTHICGKTRNGRFCVLRRSAAKKIRSKLAELKVELRRRMHDPIATTGKWLASVLRGHYQYYAVPRNLRALERFYRRLCRLWHKSLRRRSDKKNRSSWEYTSRHMKRWLPKPRIVHPYPNRRLNVNIRGRSPVR